MSPFITELVRIQTSFLQAVINVSEFPKGVGSSYNSSVQYTAWTELHGVDKGIGNCNTPTDIVLCIRCSTAQLSEASDQASHPINPTLLRDVKVPKEKG